MKFLRIFFQIERIKISFDGGKTSMNFAEAALVIQGSACIYSKKVFHHHCNSYINCFFTVTWGNWENVFLVLTRRLLLNDHLNKSSGAVIGAGQFKLGSDEWLLLSVFILVHSQMWMKGNHRHWSLSSFCAFCLFSIHTVSGGVFIHIGLSDFGSNSK